MTNTDAPNAHSRIAGAVYLPTARTTEMRRTHRCTRGCNGTGQVHFLEYNRETRKTERVQRECGCRSSGLNLGHRKHGMLGVAATATGGKHGRRGRIPRRGISKRVLVALANKAIKAGAKAGDKVRIAPEDR